MDSTFIHLIIEYRYWILFPLACFEGPVTSIVIGFLVSLGIFNPFAAYALLVMGDIVPDTLYYFLGRFGKSRLLIERYGYRVGLTKARFGIIERLWERHPGKTMWTSKLAYGLSTPFLISSGLSGMSLSLFFFYALPVTFSQYAILMTIGYFVGQSYGLIVQIFSGIEILIAAGIIFIVFFYAFTRFMRSRLLREEKEEEEREKTSV